jgi:hypothetical protein
VEDRRIDVLPVLAETGDERNELSLQLVEQRAHLRRLHARLEVVEQHVVGAVETVEAVDVALGELEVVRQIRGERREVGLLPRRNPGLLPERGRAGDLGGELGRDAACLVVVATGDANQAGVVAVR